jgi:uncharacterized secreted protein with C-terminal beta-propeller domain
MSSGNLYIVYERVGYSDFWRNGGDYTAKIYKFALGDDGLTYKATGEVDGVILDRYSIDEYNGYLRVAFGSVITGTERGNYIGVLDDNMKMVGKTPALAKGESIRSARFIGDKGYIVTFEYVDPLFFVDLSNPKSPKVLGELKVDGYSSYIQVVNKDLLLGFGVQTKQEKGKFSYQNGVYVEDGVKISLFDVSNPKSMKEAGLLHYPNGRGFYAQYLPKSLMVNKDKNLYGTYYIGEDEDGDDIFKILLLSVSNNKLKLLAEIDETPDNWNGYDDSVINENNRLLYIGNTLYSVSKVGINVYDLTTYKSIGSFKY